jgi:hypothetical protein
VETQKKILVLQKSASQNARYPVFSVAGMVTLPTNILGFGVFTLPGAEAAAPCRCWWRYGSCQFRDDFVRSHFVIPLD